MTVGFGKVLREWRARRRMSQLELSLTAQVSARHVAFLETGRSQPSRSMVLQLAEALRAPFGARNDMLRAAGYAPHYRSRTLQDDELTQVRSALEWMLKRHEPFPAYAIDRHWNIEMANDPAEKLLCALDLNVGDSYLDALLYSDKIRAAFENFPAIARHLAVRLRTESAHAGGDPVLEAAAERFAAQAAEIDDETDQTGAVLAAAFHSPFGRMSFFTTIAHFSSAEDIAVSDLRVELLFPADDATRQILMRSEASATA